MAERRRLGDRCENISQRLVVTLESACDPLRLVGRDPLRIAWAGRVLDGADGDAGRRRQPRHVRARLTLPADEGAGVNGSELEGPTTDLSAVENGHSQIMRVYARMVKSNTA